MTHFAAVDANGMVTAFYDDGVNVIPAGAIELTDAQWQEWLANQSTRAWLNSTLTTVPAPPPTLLPPGPPTPRQWLERLSSVTQAAIFVAAGQNPAIMGWLFKASGNPFIDVTAAETSDGVNALVNAGVLTAQDATTLLTP